MTDGKTDYTVGLIIPFFIFYTVRIYFLGTVRTASEVLGHMVEFPRLKKNDMIEEQITSISSSCIVSALPYFSEREGRSKFRRQ